MKTHPFISVFCFSMTTILSIMPANAVVVYDLSIADTAGAGQNTYGAATGTVGGQGGAFSGTLPTNLVFTSGAVGSSDYFIGKFSSLALTNVGDTLTLSFTVTTNNFSQTGNQSFRFGLFDIGSATTGAGGAFSPADGYRVDYGTNSTNNGIRERTGTGDNLFATGASPIVGTQTSSNFTFVPAHNTTYSGSLALELLSGGGVEITSQIGSLSATSVVDSAAAFTSFNSFGFFQLNLTGSQASVNFSALSVDYTAVPEPSTFLLLGSGLAVLWVLRRRKARSS